MDNIGDVMVAFTQMVVTSALIYINPYNDGFGGFTEMWNGDDHYIIPPIQGRLVFLCNWDIPSLHKNFKLVVLNQYKLY